MQYYDTLITNWKGQKGCAFFLLFGILNRDLGNWCHFYLAKSQWISKTFLGTRFNSKTLHSVFLCPANRMNPKEQFIEQSQLNFRANNTWSNAIAMFNQLEMIDNGLWRYRQFYLHGILKRAQIYFIYYGMSTRNMLFHFEPFELQIF